LFLLSNFRFFLDLGDLVQGEGSLDLRGLVTSINHVIIKVKGAELWFQIDKNM